MIDPYFMAAFIAVALLPGLWIDWKRHVEFMNNHGAKYARTNNPTDREPSERYRRF